MTNFNQILDEIQQQKLAVAALIDETNVEITQHQTEIGSLNSRLLDLQSQLSALTTLETRTTELAETTPTIPTSSFVNHSVSG